MERVLVLNHDYTFLQFVSWKKAVKLLYKGKVEVVKKSEVIKQNFEGTIKIAIPKIMRLLYMVKAIYKAKIPFRKKNVLIRDNFTCQYCGRKDSDNTIDHILPSSRGGESSFENCVCACFECNNKKGNRTPEEIGWKTRKIPFHPNINFFLKAKLKSMGEENILKDLFQGE